MTDNIVDETIPAGEPAAGAVSVYGQGASEEFPVLKAFQQYIDAEQSKARKRMIGLCIFFACLMTIVIALFMFMLHETARDKQAANDQLIKMLLADRENHRNAAQPTVIPVPAPAGGNNDAALKAVTDALTALQQKIAEDRAAAAATPVPAAKPSADEERLAKAELEHERRVQKADEKLRRQREALEAEKRKLADEKEKLRQQEVERQRRRLYPEYYARQDQKKEGGQTPSAAPTTAAKQQPPSPQTKYGNLSQKDIDEILAEADKAREAAASQVDREYGAKPKPNKAAAEKPTEKKAETAAEKKTDKKSDKKEDDEVIEYFKDDEYVVPVKVDGKSANWSIGL